MKQEVRAVMQVLQQWSATLRKLPWHSSSQCLLSENTQDDRRRFVRQLSVLALGLSVLKADLVLAAGKLIKKIRVWPSPDKTRLVFDISGSVTYKQFILDKPDRMVIDIKGADLGKGYLSGVSFKDSPIKAIRHSKKKDELRVVPDLTEKVVKRDVFLLKPQANYGHRLVVDLFDSNNLKPRKVVSNKVEGIKDIVVAVDAGHGGEDPGAIAYGGGYEKTITLAIAKELAKLINRTRGFKAVLVRTGDYYISLDRRVQIARENNADLFISVHADGFKDRRARGASVFALSQRGATSETAKWLAQSENATDLIGGEGGVSLGDKDDMLANVLLDLSITSTISSSIEVGNKVLSNMGRFNKLHKKSVEQAAFRVLKSKDIPSILVETGFITNPEESRKLKTKSHQREMAKAIYDGLKGWFYQKPPVGTLVAKLKREGKLESKPSRYVVKSGDTLSEIAEQFDVSLSSLRKVNKLSSASSIRVGQVLAIPI